MCLHEFIHVTHNLKSLQNFLYEKKVVRGEMMYSRCQNSLKIVDVSDNYMVHCTKKYYSSWKRRRVTCNFNFRAFHVTWYIKNCPFYCIFSYDASTTTEMISKRIRHTWLWCCRLNTGCVIRGQWVFGGIERKPKPILSFLCPIAQARRVLRVAACKNK